MNGGDTKLSKFRVYNGGATFQLDFRILPVSIQVGFDDVIVVVTSQARFVRIISVLG